MTTLLSSAAARRAPRVAPAASVSRHWNVTKLELRAATDQDPLPAGVCGRFTGVALMYNVPDAYGTVFLPGCLTKTRAEKVAQGKVKVFADHGPFTETHVGVVRSLNDVGDSVVCVADLFDTDAGRAMKEYLGAVLAAGADTGLSLGFRAIKKEWRKVDNAPMSDQHLFFQEIDVRETSITPVPAVPGTDVTSVRHEGAPDDADDATGLRRVLELTLRSMPESEARDVFAFVFPTPTPPVADTPPLTRADAATVPPVPASLPPNEAPRITDAAVVIPDPAPELRRDADDPVWAMRLQLVRESFAR